MKPDKELEQDLSNILYSSNYVLRDMYNYIMENRKMIINPLINIGQIKNQPLPRYEELCQAIEKTIINANMGNYMRDSGLVPLKESELYDAWYKENDQEITQDQVILIKFICKKYGKIMEM